jgi:hypothetical protein
MGGGSCGGCGESLGDFSKEVVLELIVEEKPVLWITGKSSSNNLYENNVMLSWASGGSSIGANGVDFTGEKSLCEQQSLFEKTANSIGYPRYSINTKVEVLR